MDVQKHKENGSSSDFRVGELVSCVRYSEGSYPQTWNRTTHIGVIVSKNVCSDLQNYTVWSEGETFECSDVSHLASVEEVFDG